MTKARRSARDRQTREELTGHGIDDFPTRKSAGLRLERFWKERAMVRKTKRGAGGHIYRSRSDGHAGPQKGGWHGCNLASDAP